MRRKCLILFLLLGVGFGLCGCYMLTGEPGTGEPSPTPTLVIKDIDIDCVIWPYFFPKDEFPPNHFPEGENLKFTVIIEDSAMDPSDDPVVYRWIIRRTKPWTDPALFSVVAETTEPTWINTQPLVGCGCPAECPEPEIWGYEVELQVTDQLGRVYTYTEPFWIVPMHYYYETGS